MAEMTERRKDDDTITGTVFEIERYAINDGPGIRTLVFLKGCGLRCLWCCNPESQRPQPELVHWKQRCIRCGRCVEACPEDALRVGEDGIALQRAECSSCGRCVDVCASQALSLVGRRMTPGEVLKEVLRDEPFYRKSGGGVTFSGGEPFEQAAFLKATAKLCKDRFIHTAVETCGHIRWEAVEETLPFIDLFLFDLKELNPARHHDFTGVSNVLVMENFKRLLGTGKEMTVRLPVVPSFNDSGESVGNLLRFLREHAPGIGVDLLPYHRLGRSKYARLGEEYALNDAEPPSRERMEELREKFTKAGFRTSIGG